MKSIIQLRVLDHLPVYHLLLALSDSNMYTNHQEIHHKQFLEVSLFWDNHITLHCMDGHFVSGASLHYRRVPLLAPLYTALAHT